MINKLVRKNIITLKPYRSARSLYTSGMFLDANENALGSVVDLPGIPDLNRYPDPQSLSLRADLAKYVGVPKVNVFAGNGSDEIIDLLIRLFVNPNEEILIVEPTYGVYRVAGDIAGIIVKSVELDSDFKLDADKVLKAVTRKTKILFCCSPNNPTGNLISTSDIEKLCVGFMGIVVVDEAYIEFASSPSFAKLVSKRENLVVLRTLSKAWGLAGIRLGYAIADEQIIKYLDKIKAPYNLNRISSAVAVRALKQKKKMLKFRDAILSEREKLEYELRMLGLTVFESEANFLLVRFQNAEQIFRALVKNFGLIVRNFSVNRLLKNCLRITIGTPKQNKLLITSLKKLL